MHRRPHIPNIRERLKRFRSVAREVTDAEVRAFAEDECASFKQRIRRQDFLAFKAIPLSPAYLARKIAKGADRRTMIATGHYLESIHVQEDGDIQRGRKRYYIGFDSRDVAHDLDGNPTDFPLTGKPGVAEVQEYGSEAASVPARPHWGPHYRLMHKRAGRVRKRVRAAVMKRV